MSSFVTEVLVSSGKLEKDNLITKITKLCKKSEDIKAKAIYMIKSKYEDFLSTEDLGETLTQEVKSMYKESDYLRDVIENESQTDLNNSVTECSKPGQQLTRVRSMLTQSQHLVEFDNALMDFHESMHKKTYAVAAEQLLKVQDALAMVKKSRSSDTPLLTMVSELTTQKEALVFRLQDLMASMIQWTLPLPTKELTSTDAFVGVKLSISQSPQAKNRQGTACEPDLPNVLQAMAVGGDLQPKIKHFGQLLMKYVLRPLIHHPLLMVEVNDLLSADGVARTTICLVRQRTSTTQHREPAKLYLQLLMVFKALHGHAFNAQVGQQTVCTVLGGLIWGELSQSLIQDCLLPSLPAKGSQLDQCAEVISHTRDFETALCEMGFVQEGPSNLLRYAQNYNCHFISRRCQDVMEKARCLMTSEIHDTVQISPDYKLSLPVLPLPPGSAVLPMDKKRSGSGVEDQEGDSTMLPLTCRVSRSAQQILELAVCTLADAVGRSTNSAIQNLYAVRNIFHLFCNIVPTYHEESLLKMPQLAAIFYNDCMFLAHHLLVVGRHFRPLFSTDYTVCSFVDLVQGLRRQGSRCFINQMNLLRGQMLDSLSGTKGFSNMGDEAVAEAASKAVKQMALWLLKVGQGWQDVLPVEVYHKAMGTLLNTAANELISRVLALESISPEEASLLHGLLDYVLILGPRALKPQVESQMVGDKGNRHMEIAHHVARWSALQELVLALRSDLGDILNRWSEGKGPLALAFTYKEVQGLIQALFPNTDRRTAALTQLGPSLG